MLYFCALKFTSGVTSQPENKKQNTLTFARVYIVQSFVHFYNFGPHRILFIIQFY